MRSAGGSSADARPVTLDIRTAQSDDLRFDVVAEPDGRWFRPAAIAPAGGADGGMDVLARSPRQFLDQLTRALPAEQLERALQRSGNPHLHLRIGDEEAARWPWEAALTGPDAPLSGTGIGGLLRWRPATIRRGPDDQVRSPGVSVAVLSPRRNRGHVSEQLRSSYRDRVALSFRGPSFGVPVGAEPPGQLLHLVADPVHRDRVPGLQLANGDQLTAESLAESLGDGSRLVVLDLVPGDSDQVTVERIMLANAFCWRLTRSAADIDVLCGMFGSANDRVAALRRLVEHLVGGDPLATIAAELQHNPPLLPRGRHPLRDVVSLSTTHPNRRFLLDRPS